MDSDEEFIDNSLAVGDIVYDEAQIAQQQQEYAAQLKLASTAIPTVVKDFIQYFHRCLSDNSVYELHGCYENSFGKLTDKFYKNSHWPHPVAQVAPLVKNDPVFLYFYSELYYRHLYAKLTPTPMERFESYSNYCNLFNYILNSDGPVDLELPTSWAWGIVDEFIYQYNSYWMSKTDSDSNTNAEGVAPDTWGTYSVLNVLYSLSEKTKIREQLRAIKAGLDPMDVAGPYGSRPLYKMLGYFCVIGLLRVHTLLGDFTLALKTMESIELTKKALFARVAPAHFATYYYVGICYVMTRRYADAIRCFSHVLTYMARTKNVQGPRYDAKRSEQMYALLAICVVLSPARLDDSIHVALRDRYGDQMAAMQRGDLKLFEELFTFAAPKFIQPGDVHGGDPLKHHLKIFMVDVSNTLSTANLKSYLNLYATMDLGKLASFLDTDAEDLRSQLVTLKMKNRQLRWTEGELADGTYQHCSELDIALENDLIHVAEAKGGRKFADWFIRNTVKNYSVQDYIVNGDKKEKEKKN